MFRLLFPYILFGVITLVVIFDPVGSSQEVVVPATAQVCPPCGMQIEREDAAVIETLGGREIFFCSEGCATEHLHAVADAGGRGDGGPMETIARDLVCNMDVGPGIAANVQGERYYFCTERCRELFLENPEIYTRESCPVCLAEDGERQPTGPGSPEFTWNGKTYAFCATTHRDLFAEDPAGYFIHTMWGIPSWLYSISVGVILVLSFGLFELISRWQRKRTPPSSRANLFRIPGLMALIRWPPFRFLCQLVVVVLFFMIIIAGLFGHQLAARNIAPLLTWTVWWGGLVILIMFMGKAWCYVCPWDAVAGWIERLSFWRVKKEALGLGLKWPKRLRNILIATIFFVGLTWIELGFGVTMKPHATALLGLLMLTLTIGCVLVFERKAFCRYGCLVGRVSGLYAMFAASEVRPLDRSVCSACTGKDCYHGNEKGYGCPTSLFPGALDENTYCIACMECVKSCPDENMTLNARPWAADLETEGRPRRDEAYLALLMVAITGFHGLSMTPVWKEMLGFLEETLGLSYIPAFSLGMFLIMAGPVLIYAGLVRLTTLLSRTRTVDYRKAFIQFAYSVLPIALFYHLAHNMEHLLMEGQKVVPLLSNPLGFAPGEHWNVLGLAGVGAWNLFGTANWNPAPLISLPTLWFVQVLLVLVGHVYSLWIADKTARRLYTAPGAAFRSQLPMLIGMVTFSLFSLWLLKQPMEMRTSAM
jgi:polyferredoxin/YHS domain-containing protein